MLILKIFRFVVIIVSYALLCCFQDSSKAYFGSVLIFSMGLFYDYASLYLNYKNLKCLEKIISIAGSVIGLFYIIVAIIGLVGIFDVDAKNNLIQTTSMMSVWNIHISYKFIMRFLITTPVLAGIEAFNEFRRFDSDKGIKNYTNEAASAKQ